MLSRTTQYSMFIVTQAFIGHIGQVQLAAYALIQIIIVRFSNGILLGMASATETLCGQTFGAKQYHMMGIYLQRSLIINLGTATIMLPVFIFASPIFKLLREQEPIATEAGNISLWFIPILYFFVFELTIQKYLQAQLKNMFVGWLSVVALAMHIFLSWLLVDVFDMGIPGAMTSMIISSWLIVIGELIYIFGGWCPRTWQGFTMAAFIDLFPILKLSISSGIMLCLQMWYTAVLVLLASYMKNAAIAISAFSICINIIGWVIMLYFGFLVASSVRVSNELGRGHAKAVKFSIKVMLATSTCIGIFFFIICLVFGNKLAYLFTRDKEIAKTVTRLYFLLALTIMFSSIQPVFSGATVGAGMQSIVAIVNLGCLYIIGLPIGVLLAYLAHMQVEGIWIGMLLGVVAQTLVLGFIIWRTDWDEQVKKASERLNKWFLKSSDESPGSFVPEESSDNKSNTLKTQEKAKCGNKLGSYDEPSKQTSAPLPPMAAMKHSKPHDSSSATTLSISNCDNTNSSSQGHTGTKITKVEYESKN
ncbi:hypothetical protein ACFE04_007951 [Oxalis oulophora]